MAHVNPHPEGWVRVPPDTQLWGCSVGGYQHDFMARWTENPKAKVRLLPSPQKFGTVFDSVNEVI